MLVRTAGVAASASVLSWWFARAGGNVAETLHAALVSTFALASAIAAAALAVFVIGRAVGPRPR